MEFPKFSNITIILIVLLYSSCSSCPDSFPHTKLELEKVPIILPYKEGQNVSFLRNSKDTINYVSQKIYEDEIFEGQGDGECLFGANLQRYNQKLFANDSTFIDLKFHADWHQRPDVEFSNHNGFYRTGYIKFDNFTIVNTYYKSYLSINVLNKTYDSVKLCRNEYPNSEDEYYFKPKFGLIKMKVFINTWDTSYFDTYEIIK